MKKNTTEILTTPANAAASTTTTKNIGAGDNSNLALSLQLHSKLDKSPSGLDSQDDLARNRNASGFPPRSSSLSTDGNSSFEISSELISLSRSSSTTRKSWKLLHPTDEADILAPSQPVPNSTLESSPDNLPMLSTNSDIPSDTFPLNDEDDAEEADGPASAFTSEKRNSVYNDLKRRITLGRNWKLTRQPSIKGRSVSPKHQIISSDIPEPVVLTEILDVAVNPSTLETTVIPIEMEKPAVTVQSSDGLSQISLEKRKKHIEVRKYILSELLETEKNYVNNMQVVMEKFRLPLLKAAHAEKSFPGGAMNSSTLSIAPNNPVVASSDTSIRGLERSASAGHQAAVPKHSIIPLVDIKIIFAYIDDLWDFNRNFSQDLNNVVERWETSERLWEAISQGQKVEEEPASIGQLFLSNSRNWNVYLKFVDNYSSAKEAIRRSEENSPAYRQFMADCLKSKECQRQGIADFLILPVQRVTRYVLLLQDLKKHTPPDHPDYANIVSALDDMRKLANTVNEVKRREEEMTRMFHVLRSVEDCPPTIISAQRRVLFEIDGFDVTRENSHLALHPIAISSAGISVVPSVASVPTNNSEGGISLLRLYIFSDLLLLAKPVKKKKEKAISKYMNMGNNDKKEKYGLFRMAWLHDIEIIDVLDDNTSLCSADINASKLKGMMNNRSQSQAKHFVKMVIHNSDAGSQTARKKFWTELAAANTAATSSSTKGPRISSKKACSIDESRESNEENLDSAQASTAPTSPTEELVEKLAELTEDPLEQLAKETLKIPENLKVRTGSNLARASTIISRSPTPRTSSLVTANPILPILFNQMNFDATGGTTQDAHGIISTAPSSVPIETFFEESPSSQSPGASISQGPLSISPSPNPESPTLPPRPPERRQSAINNMQHQKTTQTVIETFVIEFSERKQKNELLLIIEKLALEKKVKNIGLTTDSIENAE